MASQKFLETILYVNNQEKSRTFYQKILRQKPDLDVPGMTEFTLSEFSKIGLMPNKGMAEILTPPMPHPDLANGVPRCELYFYVENIQFEFDNAIASDAQLISPITDRDWGDKVCYFADPDGHIIAFAQKQSP
ncbi:VOC family protein [Flavobacterium sp.]|uniref:VOC family protein n=1 Tax=Flavobacterium sp. TaxID=239 RepID=UPI002FDDF5DE